MLEENKNKEQIIWEMLAPLYDTVSAVEAIMKENAKLKEENKYLKERVEWFEKSLEENAKVSGEAMHHFISACLDGRIKIEGNKTIIEGE